MAAKDDRKDQLLVAEPVADHTDTGARPILRTVESLIRDVIAIDFALVGELTVLIVEQPLMANIAGFRHVEERAGVDIVAFGGAISTPGLTLGHRRQILIGRDPTEPKHGGERDHDDKYLLRAVVAARMAFHRASISGHLALFRQQHFDNTAGPIAQYAVDIDMAKESIIAAGLGRQKDWARKKTAPNGAPSAI